MFFVIDFWKIARVKLRKLELNKDGLWLFRELMSRDKTCGY